MPTLIAMVNDHMPRTFGDGVIHESHIDAMVQNSEPLHELKRGALSEEEKKIGKLIADNLVVDGATLQMGKEQFSGVSQVPKRKKKYKHTDSFITFVTYCSVWQISSEIKTSEEEKKVLRKFIFTLHKLKEEENFQHKLLGGLSPLKLCACIGSACCQILLCHDKIVFKLD